MKTGTELGDLHKNSNGWNWKEEDWTKRRLYKNGKPV